MSAPHDVFDTLLPALHDITRRVCQAPCNRAGLSVLVATYFLTLAAGEIAKLDRTGIPGPEEFKAAADLIVAAISNPAAEGTGTGEMG